MNEKISCTYIGQATTLIELGDVTILTDPHLGKRVLWAKRQHPLPIDPGKLPELACVLISHSHLDHLNVGSFKYVSCGVPVIVPEGSDRSIGNYLPNPVIELSHYASYEVNQNIEITAIPLIHPNSHLFNFGPSRANAYIIRNHETGTSVFFCADSAYGPHFRETGNLGHIDLALLPIGGYKPRWLMSRKHMTPAEAVNAFDDLRADHMVPIHHGTFRLSWEKPGAPMKWLQKILGERPDLAAHIHPLKPGETFTPSAAASKVTRIHVA